MHGVAAADVGTIADGGSCELTCNAACVGGCVQAWCVLVSLDFSLYVLCIVPCLITHIFRTQSTCGILSDHDIELCCVWVGGWMGRRAGGSACVVV